MSWWRAHGLTTGRNHGGLWRTRTTESERADLVAFLKSLTDVEFTRDARFANPWE
ncbi:MULTISPECIES: hypothetical protein [Myxococcus]|uniref:hypothetical protein n=1 Tax=Myxococcus TaxID=32 RepID=UPI00157A9A6B|nr:MULTISPECIES: hypothetical protein [Myxococcus]